MTVMTVDDKPAVRLLLRQVLGDLVEHWCECSDGDEVVDCYHTWRPNWVLMDVAMPGVNGIEATRRLKAAYPEARVVIVTSYDEGALRQAAHQAGACGYVLKEDLLELRGLLQLPATEAAT